MCAATKGQHDRWSCTAGKFARPSDVQRYERRSFRGLDSEMWFPGPRWRRLERGRTLAASMRFGTRAEGREGLVFGRSGDVASDGVVERAGGCLPLPRGGGLQESASGGDRGRAPRGWWMLGRARRRVDGSLWTMSMSPWASGSGELGRLWHKRSTMGSCRQKVRCAVRAPTIPTPYGLPMHRRSEREEEKEEEEEEEEEEPWASYPLGRRAQVQDLVPRHASRLHRDSGYSLPSTSDTLPGSR